MEMIAAPLEAPIDPLPALATLLESYQDVFTKPRGLLPVRTQDHTIHLAPTAGPVNVKPYKHPYFQKEKLVNEMLGEGIIRPIASPFSSPVLLVPKKDDS